jgi:hypothetical protein
MSMRILTFDPRLPLHLLRRELRYTLVRLRRRGWAKAWVPIFEGLLKDTEAALSQDTKLKDDLEDAEAELDEADFDLDLVVLYVAKLARTELRGEALSTFMLALFGSDRPSDFVRPKLGDELERARTWPDILNNASAAALKGLASRVENSIKRCDDAQKTYTAAVAARQAFTVSTHAPLVQKVNGERKALGGDAKKQAHDFTSSSGEAGEGLFRASERTRAGRPETLESVRAELAATETELGLLRERQKALEAQRETELAHEAARKAKEQRVAELEKAQADTQSKLQTLREELARERNK